MNSIQEYLISEQQRVFEDCIKQVYKAATGEECTIEKANEIQLARREEIPGKWLIAVRGNNLGRICYYEDFSPEQGYKIGFRFDPGVNLFDE